MSAGEPAPAKTTYHSEHLTDRAAMLAMRTMIGLQPPADLGPAGRTAFDELMTKTPSAEGVTYETTVVGGVAGWWCHPADAVAGGAILYLHGAAYVVGSAQAYRHLAGQIASRARAPAFVADYGLAPERPFPAAVDDAEAACRGLIAAGFSRIAIVGDSAGGGLVLVTAARMTQAARDGLTPSPVAACVMSPWTDLALTGESIESRAKHDPLLTRGALEIARRLYLGQEDAKAPAPPPCMATWPACPLSNFTSARTRSCSTTRGDTPICWRNPAQRSNCTSGRAWRMSSPPTSPFCTPLARRSMSPGRFCGAISPTATFRTLSDYPHSNGETT